MVNILKQKFLNLQKKSPIEAEIADSLSSNVANSKINGRGNKFKDHHVRNGIYKAMSDANKRYGENSTIYDYSKLFLTRKISLFLYKIYGPGEGVCSITQTVSNQCTIYIYGDQHRVL